MKKNAEKARLLLERGADVDAKDEVCMYVFVCSIIGV
jgi:hypothetical protein